MFCVLNFMEEECNPSLFWVWMLIVIWCNRVRLCVNSARKSNENAHCVRLPVCTCRSPNLSLLFFSFYILNSFLGEPLNCDTWFTLASACLNDIVQLRKHISSTNNTWHFFTCALFQKIPSIFYTALHDCVSLGPSLKLKAMVHPGQLFGVLQLKYIFQKAGSFYWPLPDSNEQIIPHQMTFNKK